MTESPISNTQSPIPNTQPTCIYCDQPIVYGGYIQPRMCRDHTSLAILISLLKSRNMVVDAQNLRTLATFVPHAGILPEDVDRLFEPMKSAIHQKHSQE